MLRLQQRIDYLEGLLVQSSFGVLQSSLRKNGYAQVGEADPDVAPMRELAPVWTQLDHNLYSNWLRNYQEHTGATDKEAKDEWTTQYGANLPSRVLI